MLIFEVLSSPLPWKWTRTSSENFQAEFVSNGLPYVVVLAYDDSDNAWVINFHVDNHPKAKAKKGDKTPDADAKFGLNGAGNAAQVMATVKSIADDFRKNFPSRVIKFTAIEPSRQRLYNRIVDRHIPNSTRSQKAAGEPMNYRLA